MRRRSSVAAAVSKRSRTMPSEMGLSQLVGLLQSFQILKAVSLAHPLKTTEQFLMSRLKCSGGGENTNCFTKITQFFFLFGGGDGGQKQLLT